MIKAVGVVDDQCFIGENLDIESEERAVVYKNMEMSLNLRTGKCSSYSMRSDTVFDLP